MKITGQDRWEKWSLKVITELLPDYGGAHLHTVVNHECLYSRPVYFLSSLKYPICIFKLLVFPDVSYFISFSLCSLCSSYCKCSKTARTFL